MNENTNARRNCMDTETLRTQLLGVIDTAKEALVTLGEIEDAMEEEATPDPVKRPLIPLPGQDYDVFIMAGHAGDGATHEEEYCGGLVIQVVEALQDMGYRSYVHVHTIKPYGTRQDVMAATCKSVAPHARVAVELHANAHNGFVAGHESLYANTPALATAIEDAMDVSFPDKPSRGIKQRLTGNGSGFLRKAPCPAVIVEPFFIDNNSEYIYFKQYKAKLAGTIARGIASFIDRA